LPLGTNVEFMRVQGSGAAGASPWTVQRASEDATRFPAVAHAAGSIITQVESAGALRALMHDALLGGGQMSSLHDYLVMTGDTWEVDGTGDILSSGVQGHVRASLLKEITVATLTSWLTATPTTCTLFKMGIIDSAGVLRGRTADLSAATGTLGAKSGAVTAEAGQSLTLTPTNSDDFFLIPFLFIGTGTPRWARRRSGLASISIVNQATRGDRMRAWQTAGGQTDITGQTLTSTGRSEGNHLWLAVG
jgi:hypothetical protein